MPLLLSLTKVPDRVVFSWGDLGWVVGLSLAHTVRGQTHPYFSFWVGTHSSCFLPLFLSSLAEHGPANDGLQVPDLQGPGAEPGD